MGVPLPVEHARGWRISWRRESALNLTAARLRFMAGLAGSTRRNLNAGACEVGRSEATCALGRAMAPALSIWIEQIRSNRVANVLVASFLPLGQGRGFGGLPVSDGRELRQNAAVCGLHHQ